MINYLLGVLTGVVLTLYMTNVGFRNSTNRILSKIWNYLMGKSKKKEVKK